MNRENCPEKCFLTKEKEILIEISANWPSNNWAQEINLRHQIQVRNGNENLSL